MGLSVMVFFLLPWLDRGAGEVDSLSRRRFSRVRLAIFVVAFLMLGYLGTEPTNVWGQFGAWLGGAERATVVARIFTVIYFLFFLLMPWYTRIDKTKPEPESVTC